MMSDEVFGFFKGKLGLDCTREIKKYVEHETKEKIKWENKFRHCMNEFLGIRHILIKHVYLSKQNEKIKKLLLLSHKNQYCFECHICESNNIVPLSDIEKYLNCTCKNLACTREGLFCESCRSREGFCLKNLQRIFKIPPLSNIEEIFLEYENAPFDRILRFKRL